MVGFSIYAYPKTNVSSMVKFVSGYSIRDLITDSESMKDDDHLESLLKFVKILNEIIGKEAISDKVLTSFSNSIHKPKSRVLLKFNDSRSSLSVSINRVLYLCMHESAADLSMLSDFDTFKESLDIVGRSFVTRGKPLELEYAKSRIHLRDTILLAPQGAKSLAGIGDIYGGDFKKVDIGAYRQGKMKSLLKDNKDLFEKYALSDALITLKHACTMEEFNLTVDKIGVPLTLSGIGKAYVLKE